MIVADTNFWIDLEAERAAGQRGPAHAFLARHREEVFAMSVITWGELAAGYEHHWQLRGFLLRVLVLPLKEHVAWEASRIERDLRDGGGRLGENDNWIAATARIWGLRLASNDEAFDRVPRLRRLAY